MTTEGPLALLVVLAAFVIFAIVAAAHILPLITERLAGLGL